MVTERNRLRAQINTRSANAGIVVDRRPMGANILSTPGEKPVAVIAPVERLTDSELQALRRVLSPQFYEDRGWKEIEHGEIVNAKTGKTKFDPGFATGLRKIVRG